MGKIWMPGGSYADLDVVTAGAGDVLAGKAIVDQDGNTLTGTMVDRGDWSPPDLVAGASVTVPGGKHGGGGRVAAKSLAAQTGGNLAAKKMLSGTHGWSNGVEVTGEIASQGAITLNPGITAKTGNVSGKYMTGDVTVPAVNIPASYIKRGQVITFPDGSKVTGTWEGYVAGNGEIYNRGAIGLGGGFFKLDAVQTQDGGLEYFTTYMEVRTYYTTAVITNGAINITPYTKLNIIVSSVSNLSVNGDSVWCVFYTSKPDYKTVDHPTGSPPVVLNKIIGKINAINDVATVISTDISMVNTACYVGILFDTPTTGPGHERNRIYKLWLS